MGLSLDMHGAGDVAARLRDQAKRAKDVSPATRPAAVDLETVIADAFQGERSPGGDPWPELKPSTLIKRALSRGGRRAKVRRGSRRGYNVGVSLGLNKKAMRNISNVRMLRDSGRGFTSINVRAEGGRIITRVDNGYMVAHLGGDTKRNPPKPPKRQWGPFTWNGQRWAFDPSGRGGEWRVRTQGRVLNYILNGSPTPS